jgi:hypothetical protein
MNKRELESILKKALPPEISSESLEMFPRRLVARLKHNDSPNRAVRNASLRLAWAFGLAACVVIVFTASHWRGRMEAEAIPAKDCLASIKLVREMVAMFPNQVCAIVEDDHGLHLVLSDKDDVPASPPLYVRICDGKHCSSFVTFSGQEIQVAGQQVTVLSDSQGGIILEGNRFVWSSDGENYAEKNLKIEAKTLGATL